MTVETIASTPLVINLNTIRKEGTRVRYVAKVLFDGGWIISKGGKKPSVIANLHEDLLEMGFEGDVNAIKVEDQMSDNSEAIAKHLAALAKLGWTPPEPSKAARTSAAKAEKSEKTAERKAERKALNAERAANMADKAECSADELRAAMKEAHNAGKVDQSNYKDLYDAKLFELVGVKKYS